MRILMIGAAALMLISAFRLYAINYDTRDFAEQVQAQERRLEKIRQDIAILKADRALAARPEVIGPAARAMGLAPAREDQFTEPDVESHLVALPNETREAAGSSR